MCTVFRFGGLDMDTWALLRLTNKAWCAFCDAWLMAAHVEPRLDMSVRKEQTLIPHERVAHLGKCFYPLHHNTIHIGVCYTATCRSYFILWFFLVRHLAPHSAKSSDASYALRPHTRRARASARPQCYRSASVTLLQQIRRHLRPHPHTTTSRPSSTCVRIRGPSSSAGKLFCSKSGSLCQCWQSWFSKEECLSCGGVHK